MKCKVAMSMNATQATNVNELLKACGLAAVVAVDGSYSWSVQAYPGIDIQCRQGKLRMCIVMRECSNGQWVQDGAVAKQVRDLVKGLR